MDTLRVLVVDDEPGMRTGVTRALRNFSVSLPDLDGEVRFSVDQSETGEEALEKISAGAPDILLLDHKLPGLSGLDVLDRLSQEEGDLLTIMITAYASLETAVSATKQGAHDFLAKPFTPQELKGAVSKAAKHLLLQRQARKLAEERRQVRFQFISVVAHELKAPLAAIEGYLDIIRRRSLGDNLGAYDSMVERSLVRLTGMRKMVLDLLDLTRIESGQMRREMGEVDLTAIAGKAVETMTPDAEARGISIRLEADSPAFLWADAGEMEIVFNNLVSNAVKYNRDNGRVDVVLQRRNGTVLIEVRDTGIGMSEEETRRLFQEFSRIKNSKTRQISGSGLGLSTVKKISQLYDGDATVESVPDVGSTFRVILHHAPPAEAEKENG